MVDLLNGYHVILNEVKDLSAFKQILR